MVLPIYTYGDKVLRSLCDKVKIKNKKEIKEIYTNIHDTLLAAGGNGLSAPQIGISLDIFVIDTSGSGDSFFALREVFINCEIVSKSLDKKYVNEKCLSIPDISGDVMRHSWIEVKYYDENFKQVTKKYYGFDAAVIQHEYDHIRGVLFNSRFAYRHAKTLPRKLNKIKRKNFKTSYKTVKKQVYATNNS